MATHRVLQVTDKFDDDENLSHIVVRVKHYTNVYDVTYKYMVDDIIAFGRIEFADKEPFNYLQGRGLNAISYAENYLSEQGYSVS